MDLNPLGLNWLSTQGEPSHSSFDAFPLTWLTFKEEGQINLGSQNIRGAWELDQRGVELPVAVHPTNIHPRMTAQRSCFTVRGKKKESLHRLVDDKGILKRYEIDNAEAGAMLEDLRVLGVTRGALFPDLDGLAADITQLFRPDLAAGQRR